MGWPWPNSSFVFGAFCQIRYSQDCESIVECVACRILQKRTYKLERQLVAHADVRLRFISFRALCCKKDETVPKQKHTERATAVVSKIFVTQALELYSFGYADCRVPFLSPLSSVQCRLPYGNDRSVRRQMNHFSRTFCGLNFSDSENPISCKGRVFSERTRPRGAHQPHSPPTSSPDEQRTI